MNEISSPPWDHERRLASRDGRRHQRAADLVTPPRAAEPLPSPDDLIALRRSEVTAVYVQGAGGQAQLRQIRVGEASGDGTIEVLAGLREGERIALDPVKAGLLPAASR